MLSTGKSANFLPVGKNFTIPARNFLPVGNGLRNSPPKVTRCHDDRGLRTAYAKARATLERIGKLPANMDLLIAAHAAAVGAVLVTNDHPLRECSKYVGARSHGQCRPDRGFFKRRRVPSRSIT
jgi:hypothetical protein